MASKLIADVTKLVNELNRLEKQNNDLLAETLRLGKLHDSANDLIKTQSEELTELRIQHERLQTALNELQFRFGNLKMALNSNYGKFGQSAPLPPSAPASLYNWVPGQRIVDTDGVEYVKLQSTASNAHAVNLKTGKIVSLSLIMVKRSKYERGDD